MTPREQAKWRTGGRCAFVGCDALATEIHHRKLRSAGGSDEVENLLPLCSRCHLDRVHGKPAMAYVAGYLLHSWEPEDAWRDGWFK